MVKGEVGLRDWLLLPFTLLFLILLCLAYPDDVEDEGLGGYGSRWACIDGGVYGLVC